MTEIPTTRVLGALALELAPGSRAGRMAVAQAEAGALAERIARDLVAFAPETATLELVTVGAHYDAVELLRPGWPLHRALDQFAARAPRNSLPPPLGEDWGGGTIIALGAHDDRLPDALAPDPDHAGGPLRLIPFLLGTPAPGADPAALARVGDLLERELVERGMAGAATALAAQELFALKLEHARYLTLHDLVALVALQYEHAGLAPLWPLLEAALLAPEHEEWLDAPPEPLLHFAAGEARMALFTAPAWRARYAPDAPHDSDAARTGLHRRHAQFEARARQFAAVLAAHGVAVTFVHCAADTDARAALG
jgi:hypothetical protein